MTTTTQALGRGAPMPESLPTSRLAGQLAEAGALGRLAAPMVAAGVLNMGLSLTDTAMMGWLDPRALAAGVVVSDTYSILFYFASTMVGAVAPLAARALGAGDPRGAGSAIGQGLWLLAPLALVGAFLIAWSTAFMSWLGMDIPLRRSADEYALAMAATFALMLVFSWGRGALSAIGRPRVPMYVMAAILPLNALCNYLLMYGAWGLPEMGLAGAGVSSLIVAAAAAFAIVFHMCLPSMRAFAVFAALGRADPAYVLRLIPLGLMMALATLAETGVYLSSTIVVGLVATDALAAHAVVFRMLGLGYVVTVGFGQAAMVRVAMSAGSGDAAALERARDTARFAALAGAVLMLALFLGAREALLGLGPVDNALANEITALLPLVAIAMAGLVLGNVHAAILRGLTNVRVPALIALSGYWGVGFAVMWVAVGPLAMGAAGIWTGLAAGTAATAFATAAYVVLGVRIAPLPPATQ